MAYKEVDPGPADPPKNFFKFKAIGDKLAGFYVSYEEREADFDDGKKTMYEYTFKNKEGLHVVSANWDLGRRLKKADLKPGYKVMMTYVSDLPATKPGHSPQKMFKVLVDDEVKAPAPKPPPPPDDDFGDDVPF